jgi:hypothetical protein
VSDHCVRNVWLCEACGCEIKDTVYLSAQTVESLRATNPSEAMRRALLGQQLGHGAPPRLILVIENSQASALSYPDYRVRGTGR